MFNLGLDSVVVCRKVGYVVAPGNPEVYETTEHNCDGFKYRTLSVGIGEGCKVLSHTRTKS